MRLIDFMKRYSRISNEFIEDFFGLYDNSSTDTVPFLIDSDVIVKWLDTTKFALKKTLSETYKKNTDYVIRKSEPTGKKGAPREVILLTPKCFKLMAMQSRTKKAIQVREYYYELEVLLDKYKEYIIAGLNDKIQALENNQRPKVNPEKGVIYVLQGSDDTSVYKLGKTTNLKSRMRSYNADKKDDVVPIYIYETDDVDTVEACVKALSKKYQYRKYKEVYQINLDLLKKFIDGCAELDSPKVALVGRNTSKRVTAHLTTSGDDGKYYMLFERKE